MMKKLVYISILSLLLLSSCRSKRMITVSLPQPVMQADSTQLGDTIGLPARLSPMFTFDQSDLRNVRRQPAKGEVKKQQIKKTAPVQKVIVQRGTRITSKTTHVGSAYKGVSRIKTYDFTHRDVPAAFEGFRIAFVSDLHYKSLLKEEGLKDLVRLLIDQKADVLLIGGDFHEGCQYVPPVMAAGVIQPSAQARCGPSRSSRRSVPFWKSKRSLIKLAAICMPQAKRAHSRAGAVLNCPSLKARALPSTTGMMAPVNVLGRAARNHA